MQLHETIAICTIACGREAEAIGTYRRPALGPYTARGPPLIAGPHRRPRFRRKRIRKLHLGVPQREPIRFNREALICVTSIIPFDIISQLCRSWIRDYSFVGTV